MKKLLTNGCSHTEGSECNKSFGDFIKDYEHINLAKGGCGNHRIMRTTMEYCENNPVDLVIIGWSTHERFEFSFDGDRKDYTLYKQSENLDLQKFYRYADLHLADWTTGLEDTISYMFALQTYLDNKGIEYIFCNMFNSIPEDCRIPLWNSIDTSKYYMPNTSFIEDYLEKYPNDFSESMHIKNEVLYEKIAGELYNMYLRRYRT